MPDLNTAFPTSRFQRAGLSSAAVSTLAAAWALLSPAVQDAENTYIEGLSDLQVAAINSFPVSGGAVPAPQQPSGQIIVVNEGGGGLSTSTPVAELPASILDGVGVSSASIDPRIAVVQPTAALTVPTGFAGNDIVEPSVLYDPTAPFLGFEYVLCAAPFPTSDATKENPCLWVSHEGTTWTPVVNGVPTPAGTVTPIFPQGVQGDGNNSDPYLYRGPDGTYYLLWNQFLVATPTGTGTGGHDWAVKMSQASSLAGPWSTPVNVIATTLATSRPTCPSIFWDQATSLWHMYALEFANTSATFITHYTATTPAGPWTQLGNPTISLPAGFTTQEWWHLNAYKLGSLHVLIVDDSPKAAESNPGNLWLLTSADRGVTWTVPAAPLLTTAQANAYRSAIIPTRLGYGIGFDLFYGSGETPWALHRSTITFTDPNGGGGASIPLAVQSFRFACPALIASANNQVAVTFPVAYAAGDTNYTLQGVSLEDTTNVTTDTTVVRHWYNKSNTGFTVIINPGTTAWVAGRGVLHCLAVHD